MIRMFSMISKKNLILFRLYPIYHRSAIHIAGVGPSRIDVTKIQKRCEPASRRGADANCINRNGARGAQRSVNRSH